MKTRQNIGPPVTPTASRHRWENKDPEQLNDIQLPVAIRGNSCCENLRALNCPSVITAAILGILNVRHEHCHLLDREVENFESFAKMRAFSYSLLTLPPTRSKLADGEQLLEATQVWRGRRQKEVVRKSGDIWPPVRENLPLAFFGTQTVKCQHLMQISPEWPGEFCLRVHWGPKFMTSQKAPFKYCYSFSSDQKHHLCKVTLSFQASPNISRVFADTKLWEATPWHPLRTTERLNSFPKVTQWVKRTVQFMLLTSY